MLKQNYRGGVRYSNEMACQTDLTLHDLEDLRINSTIKVITRDEITDEQVKGQIPKDAEIHIQYGSDFDFNSIKIEEQIP